MKAEFLPYRARPGAIRIDIRSSDESLPASGGHRILVPESVSSITLEVSAAVPDNLLTHVLPPEERDKPPVELRLVYGSVESRARHSQRLQGNGVYSGELHLRREDWRGTVLLRACLVRTLTSRGEPAGYATERGALLASSADVQVIFDEMPAPQVSSALPTEWRSFKNDERLKEQSDRLFALVLRSEGPLLLLNSDIAGTPVLNSNATTGRAARIRDLTNSLIVHQVLTSLLAHARVLLAPFLEDEEDARSVLSEQPDWVQNLLREWAPALYPEMDRDEALDELLNTLRSDKWSETLLLYRLPSAIQGLTGTASAFSSLVSEVTQ